MIWDVQNVKNQNLILFLCLNITKFYKPIALKIKPIPLN